MAIAVATAERRIVVDRRRGPERRSTLERRGRRGSRQPGTESPGEHVRNALQMLGAGAGAAADLDAAVTRLHRALELLERRAD
ncbi:MAG: hypothetical protein ACREMJ_12170 [Gemmatimonadales bacterium]